MLLGAAALPIILPRLGDGYGAVAPAAAGFAALAFAHLLARRLGKDR
jgi:hypothetical protein